MKINDLINLLKKSENVGSRKWWNGIIVCQDTKIIFRKDYDEYAHPISRKSNEKINHFNIEIQKFLKKKDGKYINASIFYMITMNCQYKCDTFS